MMNNKAMLPSFLVGTILALILIAIMIFLFPKFFSPANDIVGKCSATGGMFVPRAGFDYDISIKNTLVDSQLYEDETYYCVIPKPGAKDKYLEEYEKYFSHILNKDDRDSEEFSEKKSGKDTPSGFKRSVSENEDVQFFVNGNPVDQKLSHFYSKNLPVNVELQGGTTNEFTVKNSFSNVDKCTFTLYPAKLSGNNRILSDKDVAEKYKFENKSNCEGKLTLPQKPLLLIDTEPGFYKLDFWGSSEGKPAGSASAFIGVTGTPEEVEENTAGIIIRPLVVSSRNNRNICYLAAYTTPDLTSPDQMSYELSNSATASGNSVTLLDDYIEPSPTINLYPKNSENAKYAHITFIHEEERIERTYSYNECDLLKFTSTEFYTANFNTQQETCDTLSNKECAYPQQRLASYDKVVLNCNYDKKWPFGGTCYSCTAIQSCDQYDDEVACTMNQCLGEDTMDQRCFWNKDGKNSCQTCNYNPVGDVCDQYKDKTACEADACKFDKRVNTVCTWKDDSCKKV